MTYDPYPPISQRGQCNRTVWGLLQEPTSITYSLGRRDVEGSCGDSIEEQEVSSGFSLALPGPSCLSLLCHPSTW